MLALRLPPEIEQRLDALAKKTGRTQELSTRARRFCARLRTSRTIIWRGGGSARGGLARDAREPGAGTQAARQEVIDRAEFGGSSSITSPLATLRKLGVEAERRVLRYLRERICRQRGSAPPRPRTDRRPQGAVALSRRRLPHRCRESRTTGSSVLGVTVGHRREVYR